MNSPSSPGAPARRLRKVGGELTGFRRLAFHVVYANSANDRPFPKKHGVRFFLAINEDKQCLALAWKDRIDRRVNRGICLGTWAVGTFVATAVAACERMMLPSIRGFSSTSVHCFFSSGLIAANSRADPRAISKNRFLSLRLCLPLPSAMFSGIDCAARSH